VGLSGDQKALLRLLAQREQGYDDVAALMGLSVDEVRVRVKDALDAVEREPGATEPAPPPPEPVAEKRPEPAAEKAPAPKPKSPPPKAAAEKPATPRPSLPKERRVLAIAGGLGAIVLIIVLLATGAIGGGDDTGSGSDPAGSGSDPAATSELTKAEEAVANAKDLTKAVLSPVDGSDAKGLAVFGRLKDRLALQIQAEGLEPTGDQSSYTVWLTQSPQRRLPLASTRVPESGQISAQVEVPTEILAYLAKGTFDELTLSLTEDAQLKASVEKAAKETKSPDYTGTDVLQGKITGPIVGAGDKAGEGGSGG
jgi:outer membrane biosynthesis protein TonB